MQGAYRIAPEGGQPVLIAEDFEAPNGLAFSPDEGTLYIDDSERQLLRAFDVQPDGSLGRGRLFHEMDTAPESPTG